MSKKINKYVKLSAIYFSNELLYETCGGKSTEQVMGIGELIYYLMQ